MRVIFAAALACAFAVPCSAGDYVNGYIRQDGTYVQPYYRSAPDGTQQNNYSYEGNINPYTGAVGTRGPSDGGNNFTQPTYPTNNNLNRR